MKSNKYYRVTQLDADLWAIEDIKTSENSIVYVLCAKDKALVFDTGPGLGPILPLIKEIIDAPVVVCLSHWHFDHSGGAHEFDEVIAWNSAQMKRASKQGARSSVISTQITKDFWESVDLDSYETKKFPKASLISQERELDMGGYNLKILHTPGHTEDSICLYEAKKGWLFSGDTVYPGPIYLQFPDSDVRQYAQTLRKLQEYKISAIFPGHNAVKVSGKILSETQHALDDKRYKSSVYPSLRVLQR